MNDVSGVGDAGSVVGIIAGKGGSFIGDFASGFSSYITNMGFVEWFLLLVLVVGGFFVWYLKKKYKLVFRLWPKKPKKTFN